jgi:hypothetical protein
MYSVFKQLGNGEFVQVATRDDLEQAIQLAQSLHAEWPGKYEVRDSHAQTVRYTFSASHPVDTEFRMNHLGRHHVSPYNVS